MMNHGIETETPSIAGNVPAFLVKLWRIVGDESLDSIISWSQNGQTFKVHDQTAFAKDILPKYYKHSNFSSFVRQVNMYGFRKIVDAQSGSLKHDKDEWEFFHQSFQLNKPELLAEIKRKASNKESDAKSNQISSLLTEVERLKLQHETVASKLENMKSENEMLWSEVGDLRDQHRDQQTVINKLIQVFVKIVMSNKKDRGGNKRRALDFPAALDNKHAKMTQDLLPYSSSTNQNIYPSLLPDRMYSVESPGSPYPITEVPTPTNASHFDNSMISVIDDSPMPLVEEIDNSSSTTNPISNISFPSNGKQPLVVKSEGKTITIVPNQPSAVSNMQMTAPQMKSESDFAFPEKYNGLSATSKCLNTDMSQMGFEVIKCMSKDNPSNDCSGVSSGDCSVIPADEDIITVVPNVSTSSSEPFLSTPDTLLPPALNNTPRKHALPQKFQQQKEAHPVTSEMSLVPVAPILKMPPSGRLYSRQRSYKDKQELNENVQNIGRSIEMLQGLLESQPVNIDVKSLNLDFLPENMTIQDVAKLVESGGANLTVNAITEGPNQNNKDDSSPVSPSAYIDPQFEMSSQDFFDSVLDNQSSSSAT